MSEGRQQGGACLRECLARSCIPVGDVLADATTIVPQFSVDVCRECGHTELYRRPG